MSTYAIVLLLAVCSFVACPDPDPPENESILYQWFQDWKSTDLCKDGSPKKAKIAEKCLQFRNPHIQNAYSVQKMREESKCKVTLVRLYMNTYNTDRANGATIGICYLSRTQSICLSDAQDPHDVLVWTRQEVQLEGMTKPNSVCHFNKIIKGFWTDEELDTSTPGGQDVTSEEQ